MKRSVGMVLATSLAVIFVSSGCGNLKKKEFLPQYDQYKAENAAKFQSIDASISTANTQLADLAKADASLKEQIQDAKEEALAAAEQGDADSLAAAKANSKEADDALRQQLLAAVDAAKKASADNAKAGDDGVRKDVMAALDDAKNSAMQTLQQLSTKSAGDVEALRAEVASALAKAIPVKAATVTFASGKAVLTDAAKGDLDKAAAAAKGQPSATVKVIGHADSNPIVSGKYLTNLQLSEARANAAADYLKSKGVSNKIVVIGRGHFETAAVQSTKEGRQDSRRVEVLLESE